MASAPDFRSYTAFSLYESNREHGMGAGAPSARSSISSVLPPDSLFRHEDHSKLRSSFSGATDKELTKKYSVMTPVSATTPAISQAVNAIFENRIQDAFEERCRSCVHLLDIHPHRGLGDCINKLRMLNIHECACRLFDRLTCNVRTVYEDEVIQQFINKARQQCMEGGEFQAHLVLYHPGKFGSETVLFTRLAKELLAQGLRGEIHISSIEPEHAGIVSQGKAMDHGFQLAIDEFTQVLTELQYKTGIRFLIKAHFESARDYHLAVHHEDSWRHDFFLGSDLGPIGADVFAPLFYATRKNRGVLGDAIILYGTKASGEEKVKMWVNGAEREVARELRPLRTIEAAVIDLSAREQLPAYDMLPLPQEEPTLIEELPAAELPAERPIRRSRAAYVDESNRAREDSSANDNTVEIVIAIGLLILGIGIAYHVLKKPKTKSV